MSNEEKEGARRMVVETIIRLRKSNTEPAHVGSRYARLISLLWRRPPRRQPTANSVSAAVAAAATAGGLHGHALAPNGIGAAAAAAAAATAAAAMDEEANLNQTATDSLEVTNGDFSLNTFSWLDLDSVGHFATANNDASPSFADVPPPVEDGNGMVFGMHAIDSQQWFNDRPQDLVF